MDYIIMGLGIAVGFYLLPVVFGGWEIPAGMMHTFEVIGNIYENKELLS